MNEPNTLRRMLHYLREDAELSQSKLAERLPFTASRVSRLESGELDLTMDEAKQIAQGIGTPKAIAFADFLSKEWRVLEPVGFNHVSREPLWEAEVALQQLQTLEGEPTLKNAFVKQIQSCRAAIERSARFLQGTDHPIAFVGRIAVGKTTAICALANLRDSDTKELNKQMVLQTGSGRTTICEVQIRNGGEYAISTEPCADEELRHWVGDFCEYIRELASLNRPTQPGEGSSISSEVVRALRSLSGLTERRLKESDGRYRKEDLAVDLVKAYPSKEELQIQVLSKIDLARRWRTSMSHPRDAAVSGMEWLSKAFAEINCGRHPEFSLPKRIDVSVPSPILETTMVDIQLVDTRGVDETSALRRDLQTYFDNERALIVFCSGFEDAPDGAMQAVIERARDAGLQTEMLERGMLLILPRGEQEMNVRDGSSGELVADIIEGREVRGEQAQTTLRHIGFAGLATKFLDVTRPEDCDNVRRTLVERVLGIRRRVEDEIRVLTRTVNHLIVNKADEEVRAVFEQATHRLRIWFANHRNVPEGVPPVQDALLEEMEGLHASTLRASINRFGDYDRFDYWHGLGFGARRGTKRRTDKLIAELRGVIQNAIDDEQMSHAHDFLRHFKAQVEEEYKSFLLGVQALGETAFHDQLRVDHDYWSRCRSRWGTRVPGYKLEIKAWTGDWFGQDPPRHRQRFIEEEIQQKWAAILDQLEMQLETAGPSPEVLGTQLSVLTAK
ncbi:MAG: helix-turn-helix domain-containing protein [Acidobacteria bacterium]|nr:helix-turn-helix domain-containing protein [Acidobacteriota bacterium]MCI0720644.1 helix-turn-helix domain-containing protein [Acidobacteriota bacterium]